MPAWFEDEEFWTATYPFMFPDDRERAGFSPVTLYGDLDGNPYGREAVRLVALVRRAG